MRIMKRVFAIDPGISGTGWAVLDWYPTADDYCFVAGGNIYGAKHVDWQDKATQISKTIRKRIGYYAPTIIVCEFPTFMAGKAVSSKSDSTVKMAYIVGVIRGIAWEMTSGVTPFQLVLPNTWKGTMSKALTERRVRKKLEIPSNLKAHAIDAVGIALWHVGEW